MGDDRLTKRIEEIIAPSIEAIGFEVVRVRMMGGQESTLQIMADRTDGTTIDVDDCAEISRLVSALLDVEDPIKHAYNLEVSSPGIDRPLTRLKDFERFAGFEAKIETRAPIDGRKRFRGRLKGVEDDTVRIALDTHEAAIDFDNIDRAKLVLTDDLIAAAQQAEQHGN